MVGCFVFVIALAAGWLLVAMDANVSRVYCHYGEGMLVLLLGVSKTVL